MIKSSKIITIVHFSEVFASNPQCYKWVNCKQWRVPELWNFSSLCSFLTPCIHFFLRGYTSLEIFSTIIIQISSERFFLLSVILCFKDIRNCVVRSSHCEFSVEMSVISVFTFTDFFLKKKTIYYAEGIKLWKYCFSSLCLRRFVSSQLQK